MRIGLALGVFLLVALPASAYEPEFDDLWNFREPEETEKKFRKLLPAAKKKGLDYHAQLLTQIARTKGLRGDFDEAHKILNKVEKMLTSDCVIAHIRYRLERGRTFNSAGQKQNAIPLFKGALKRSEDAKAEFYAVDAAHMLGIAEQPDKALEWNVAAIRLAEAARDERAKKWLGALYNNTGWTYHDKGDYERALEYFEKGLAYRTKHGQARPMRIAKWTIARTLRSMKRYDEALVKQRELLAEWEKAGEEDAFVYEEMGEILWALDKENEARTWFKKAYPLLMKIGWLVRSEPKRIQSVKERAGIKDDEKDGK